MFKNTLFFEHLVARMFKNTLVFEHRKAEKREPLERNPFYYLRKTIRSPKTTILRERSGLRPNSMRRNYLKTDFLAKECTKTHGFFNIKIFDAKNPPQKKSIPTSKSEDLPHGIGGEARVMSPSSVGQGGWGPLNEDNRFG